MKRLGIRRGIDKIGRLCIPKEMRQLFKLDKEVEIVLTEEGVLVRNPEYVLTEAKENKQFFY